MTAVVRSFVVSRPPPTTTSRPADVQLHEAQCSLDLARSILAAKDGDLGVAQVLLSRAVNTIDAPSDHSVAATSTPEATRAQLLRARLSQPLSRDQLSQELSGVDALITEHKLASRDGLAQRRAHLLLIVALAAIATLLIPIFAYFRYPSDRYEWRASSSTRGYASSGFLGQLDAFALIVHTGYQAEPWVEIDLEKTRTIKRVIIRQRLECCQDQGIPMVIEIAGEDKQWRQIAEKTTSFDSWSARFSPQAARWVRIRSTAKSTAIQLREVRID